jgi:hypothetical protein
MTRATEPATPATIAAVRLSGSLPKNDANGLRDVAKHLVDYPQQMRYALIAYDVARLIDDLDSDIDTAVVRIQRIEPVFNEQADTVRELLEAAAKARASNGQLQFDDNEAGDDESSE